MDHSRDSNSKAIFRSIIESKNHKNNENSRLGNSKKASRVRQSKGTQTKMFRRKSG
jgi:hypothetical protein